MKYIKLQVGILSFECMFEIGTHCWVLVLFIGTLLQVYVSMYAKSMKIFIFHIYVKPAVYLTWKENIIVNKETHVYCLKLLCLIDHTTFVHYFFRELAKLCPLQVDSLSMDSPHIKALLLLQAHFSHLHLPCSDYYTDLKSVLDQSIRILQVCCIL